jgi:hypothetical protein
MSFRFKPVNLISIDEIIEASKGIQHEDGLSTDELQFFRDADVATESFWSDYPEFLQRIMVRAFGQFVTSTGVLVGSSLVRELPTDWINRPAFEGWDAQSMRLWSALSRRMDLKRDDEDGLDEVYKILERNIERLKQ